MGWIFALGLAALGYIGLWACGRCPRPALLLAGAALLLALAGYAWQGNPGMAGKPVTPTMRQDFPQAR